jgi:hypothetical protein
MEEEIVSTSETPPPPPAAPPQPAAAQPVFVQSRGNGLGTAGFVCGLLATIFGLVPFMFFLSFLLGLLGVIFGGVGWRRATRDPTRGGKGLSIAGLILGLIGFILAIVSVVAINAALD